MRPRASSSGLSRALALFSLVACGGGARSPSTRTTTTAPSALAPTSCSAGLAAAVANAARAPGRSHVTSRAIAATVRARADASGTTCEGIVDVAWLEAAPPALPAPDAFDRAADELARTPLHVIRRLWQRGHIGPGPELAIIDGHDEPRPAWLVTGEVEACRSGPLAQLGLATAAEVDAGYHLVVPRERAGRCFIAGSGTSVVPTGELLRIFQSTDTSNTHYAFRVILQGEPVWIMPTVQLRGGFPNPVGPHSAIDGEDERLDCEPDQDCWGSRDEAWAR